MIEKLFNCSSYTVLGDRSPIHWSEFTYQFTLFRSKKKLFLLALSQQSSEKKKTLREIQILH